MKNVKEMFSAATRSYSYRFATSETDASKLAVYRHPNYDAPIAELPKAMMKQILDETFKISKKTNHSMVAQNAYRKVAVAIEAYKKEAERIAELQITIKEGSVGRPAPKKEGGSAAASKEKEKPSYLKLLD